MAYKTPGVYIVEKNAFPNSVVEVATAVPVFIGHTQKADNRGKSLTDKPWRITSVAEYHQYYGFEPDSVFEIAEKTGATRDAIFKFDGKEYVINQVTGAKGGQYLLYYSMLHFFQNGGGPCYVVSVGDYSKDVEKDSFTRALDELVKEQEPTIVVIPDAVLLDEPNCIAVQQAMLAHCGGKMKNRFAILDIYHGDKMRSDEDCITTFRNDIGKNYLNFAAAYYPWVNTSLVQNKDLSYRNFTTESKTLLTGQLKKDFDLLTPPAETDKQATAKYVQLSDIVGKVDIDWSSAKKKDANGLDTAESYSAAEIVVEDRLGDSALRTLSPLYVGLVEEIARKLNLLPPGPAMAGIYAMVDGSRGVWKAPANVSLAGVISPAVNISNDEQEDLNVSAQGKSINAIRSFIGEGVLVWGARTLDGNSLDWRYINVRRTMIMLEESCRLAAKAMVFEPNTANTWVTMKSMIGNFLNGIWKRGGLAGASPEDAFSVHVGLGETMTPEDILEGYLRVTVLVAISRPAEFIEITFQQQMQKS